MRASTRFETLADLRRAVGGEAFVTDWVTMDQRRIDLFAQATEDFQWIHVDAERARRSPQGGTIAHGLLTLGMLGRFFETHLALPFCAFGLNYGYNRVRFPAPVPVDSRLRGRFVLARLDDIEGGVQLTFAVTLEVEGGAKPVCVAEAVLRSYFHRDPPAAG